MVTPLVFYHEAMEVIKTFEFLYKLTIHRKFVLILLLSPFQILIAQVPQKLSSVLLATKNTTAVKEIRLKRRVSRVGQATIVTIHREQNVARVEPESFAKKQQLLMSLLAMKLFTELITLTRIFVQQVSLARKTSP